MIVTCVHNSYILAQASRSFRWSTHCQNSRITLQCHLWRQACTWPWGNIPPLCRTWAHCSRGKLFDPSMLNADPCILFHSHFQAECALTLWKEGCITCDNTATHNPKPKPRILKAVNKVTGKESTRATDFNLANWGTATNSYVLSIKKNLLDDKFDIIIADAMCSTKGNLRDLGTMSTVPKEEYDEHAWLCNDSDIESDNN